MNPLVVNIVTLKNVLVLKAYSVETGIAHYFFPIAHLDFLAERVVGNRGHCPRSSKLEQNTVSIIAQLSSILIRLPHYSELGLALG